MQLLCAAGGWPAGWLKSSFAFWLPVGSGQCKMPPREGEVRLWHFIHVTSGSLWAGHMPQPKVSAPDWQPPLPCPLCVWVLITFRPSSNNEVFPAPTHPRVLDPLLCLLFYLPTALSTVPLYSSLENFLSWMCHLFSIETLTDTTPSFIRIKK